MPYYKWKGIDLEGRIHSGKTFARTPELLTQILLHNDIALMHFKQLKKFFSTSYKVQAAFFRNLSMLLNAGIRLQDALLVVQVTIKDNRFIQVLQDCTEALNHGLSLSTAFAHHPDYFDHVTIALIKSSEESGKLTSALDQRARYTEQQEELYKQLRASLFMPIMTFIGFIIIALTIFIGIIPRFESLIQHSNNKAIPFATSIMFMVSTMLRNIPPIQALLLFFVIGASFFLITQTQRFKIFIHSLVLNIPGLKPLIVLYSTTFFLQALALLLNGKIHVVTAVNLAAQSINNITLRKSFENMSTEMKEGYTFSSALSKNSHIKATDLQAYITIGESSGVLAPMIQHASGTFAEELQRSLKSYTSLVQPCMLIILGLLVAFLIMAIYLPIFTLSTNIS